MSSDSVNSFLNIDTTNTQLQDTFYGVSSESLIPYRKTETYQEKVQHTEKQENKFKEPTPHARHVYFWQTALLLFALFLIAFVKAFSNNRFKQTAKALLNYSVSQEITREEKVFFHRANLMLVANYVIVVSLFIYYLLEQLSPSVLKNTSIILLLMLGVIVLYCIKYLFSKVLFFVFNNTGLSVEYIFNISLFNNLLGILLLPSLFFIYFSDFQDDVIISYIAIPSIFISFIMRVVRLFVLGNNKGISYLYIFLYICTLEILPLVVLYRFFILK